ncbi:MAG TPA: hypothetical protein VMT23_00185 [Candidatus Binatia bacterium]|nr:hypothetical protein [Candidatus Binatia bacterium]
MSHFEQGPFDQNNYTTYEPVKTAEGEQLKASNPETGLSRLVTHDELLTAYGKDPNDKAPEVAANYKIQGSEDKVPVTVTGSYGLGADGQERMKIKGSSAEIPRNELEWTKSKQELLRDKNIDPRVILAIKKSVDERMSGWGKEVATDSSRKIAGMYEIAAYLNAQGVGVQENGDFVPEGMQLMSAMTTMLELPDFALERLSSNEVGNLEPYNPAEDPKYVAAIEKLDKFIGERNAANLRKLRGEPEPKQEKKQEEKPKPAVRTESDPTRASVIGTTLNEAQPESPAGPAEDVANATEAPPANATTDAEAAVAATDQETPDADAEGVAEAVTGTVTPEESSTDADEERYEIGQQVRIFSIYKLGFRQDGRVASGPYEKGGRTYIKVYEASGGTIMTKEVEKGTLDAWQVIPRNDQPPKNLSQALTRLREAYASARSISGAVIDRTTTPINSAAESLKSKASDTKESLRRRRILGRYGVGVVAAAANLFGPSPEVVPSPPELNPDENKPESL